jgi:hypothetical protein
MSARDTGGPAFPSASMNYGGMTLRDYFAAKAMQAFMVGRGEFADSNKQTIAECAYDMADVMLKAREA